MSRNFATILIALGAAVFFAGYFVAKRLSAPRHVEMTLGKPVDRSSSVADEIILEPVFPTRTVAAPVFKGNFWASPQIAQLDGRPSFLLVMPSNGSVAALEFGSGRRIWETILPRSDSEEIFLRAAPAQFADQLLIAYTVRSRKSGGARHVAVVIDMRSGEINRDYPQLTFEAKLPVAGVGAVTFDPEWQLPRAVTYVPEAGASGQAYVTFGANGDQGAWHGWLFAIDLNVWKSGGIRRAVTSVFVTTPEADCDDGTNGKICGGGLWAYDGVQIESNRGGPPTLLAQTGNGRFDLSRQDYGQALLRLDLDLRFSPQCDWKRCSEDDPRAPSEACLASCRNLFVPRLLATDPPFRTPDGACDGKTYMECLEIKDWDFGSSTPRRIAAKGHSYYVTAGKAGDIFLIDGQSLGILYDRKQAVQLCGTKENPCNTPNEGLTMTQPELGYVDGTPTVIIPTYNTDAIHPSGIVAYRVVGIPQHPRLQEAWRVPDPASKEATRWFRAPPTRPIMSTVNHEQILWVADNGKEGRVLGIRVADGKVLANMRTAGWPMRNARPVIHDGILYLPAAVQGREDLTWIEAYRLPAPTGGQARH